MKRWIAFVATLYPRSWREEFGAEFGALLDDVRPCWRVFANVLGGALKMQMTTGTNWLKLAAATAIAGVIVAWGLSFTVAPQYVSTAAMSITPQPDPLRPTPPDVLRQRAAEKLAQRQTEILSRYDLSKIIQDPHLQLYQAERQRLPLEDLIEQMRRNIRIETRPSTDGGLAPIVFTIAFTCPDGARTQATVRRITEIFIQSSLDEQKFRDAQYREFWQDVSRFEPAKPAPPPPVGEIVQVLQPASPPMASASPERVAFPAWGLSTGLLLGLLAALAMRWLRGVWQTWFPAALAPRLRRPHDFWFRRTEASAAPNFLSAVIGVHGRLTRLSAAPYFISPGRNSPPFSRIPSTSFDRASQFCSF